MHVILAWISLGFLIAACLVLAVIQFKMSAWWGPRRSVLEPMDEKEIRIAKTAGVLFILAVVVGSTAATLYWIG